MLSRPALLGDPTLEAGMDQTLAALRRDVDDLDEVIRGDGNGKPGLASRIRTLETRDGEVQVMLKEWRSTKDQLRGARATLIGVGIVLTVLGGGLGVAILSALSRLAAGLP